MKIKEELKKDWPSLTVVLVTLLGSLVVIQLLPDRVPIHWNAEGKADGWGSPWTLMLMPLTNLWMWPLLFFVPFIDPRLRKNGPEKLANMLRVMREFRLVLVSFFAFITGLIAISMAGAELDGGRIVFTATFAVLVYVGNLLTRIPPNWFSGIRTPWTLEDPEVWRKTQRVGGRLMVFGGLLLMALVWLIPLSGVLWVMSVWMVLLIIGLPIYSWWLWRNGENARPGNQQPG